MNIRTRIKTVVLSTLLLCGFTASLPVLAGTAYAASTPSSTVCDSIGSGKNCNTKNGSNLNDVVKFIVNLLSYIAGALAVIMIIVSGYKYMTAAGDSSKVASAKTTLIYAIIGIIIVVLAQFIVQFTIGKTAKVVTFRGGLVANLSRHAIK